MIQKSLTVLVALTLLVLTFGMFFPWIISSGDLPVWIIITTVMLTSYSIGLAVYGIYSFFEKKSPKRKKK